MTRGKTFLFTMLLAFLALVQGAWAALNAPTISCDPSTMKFLHSAEVTISSDDPDAVIHYTINGANPTTMSPVYTGPITLAKTAYVRAVAAKGGEVSAVTVRTITKVISAFTVEPSVEVGNYKGSVSVTFTPKGGTSPYTISYSVNDGTPVSATSSFTLSLSDTSTINIKANDANGSVDLSYTYNIEPVDNTPHTFKLVTELAELSDNSQVFFAAQYNGNMYVMGAANDKNRQAVRVTLQEEDLPPKVMMSDTKYGIMKVRNNADGSFSFYDVENMKWLKVGSANNAMGLGSLTKDDGSLNDSALTDISLNNSVASVVFRGKTSGPNNLKFNSSSLFSCYKADFNEYSIYIYVRVDSVGTPKITGNTKFTHSTVVTITADPGATIHYTTNNTEPTVLSPVYTGPFTITKQTNVYALAERAGFESKVAKMTFKPQNVFTVSPNVEPGTYYGSVSVTFTPKNGTSPYAISYSVDGGSPTSTTSSFTLNLTKTSTISISATDNAEHSVADLSYTYTILPVDNTPQTFKLVTDLAELKANSEVVFATTTGNFLYVMGKVGDDNRNAVSTKLGQAVLPKALTLDANYAVLKIQINDDASYSFYDVARVGYLQSVDASANNYLRTKSMSDLAHAKVSLENGVANVTFGTVKSNTLMFNTSAALFSCYESGFKGGLPVYIYVKTDKPTAYGAVTVAADLSSATIDGDYKGNDGVDIYMDTKVDTVIFNREFAEGDNYSSIVMPFSIDVGKVDGVTFYKITSVSVTEGAVAEPITSGKIEANKPYLMKTSAQQIVFHGSFVLNASKKNDYIISDNWEFRGTYSHILFGDSVWTILGRAYGYTAEEKNEYKIGEFAKANAEATIPAMRAYLVYVDEAEANSLPKSLNVKFLDGEGSLADEAELDVSTGVILQKQDNRWLDVQGRLLNGKPTTKGRYLHNGKMVIIK